MHVCDRLEKEGKYQKPKGFIQQTGPMMLCVRELKKEKDVEKSQYGAGRGRSTKGVNRYVSIQLLVILFY